MEYTQTSHDVDYYSELDELGNLVFLQLKKVLTVIGYLLDLTVTKADALLSKAVPYLVS